MLSISCPKCAKRLKLPPEAVGKKVKCSGCRHRFVIDGSPKSKTVENPEPLSLQAASPASPSRVSVPMIACAALACAGVTCSFALFGMYRSAIARSGETELVAASAEQRAADAEREIKTRDVHIEAMKADRQKLNTVGRNGNAELAAENARLKREKRELASQVEKLTKEKRDLLEERGVMARAQLAGLTHEEQAETGAILKKINAGTLLTMEENLRLTTLCGGPAARRLLFPQFEKAGESAIRAWAEQTTPSAEASQ